VKKILGYIGNFIGIIPVVLLSDGFTEGPDVLEIEECEGSVKLQGTNNIKMDPKVSDRVIHVLKNKNSLTISFYAALGEIQINVYGSMGDPVYYKKIGVNGYTTLSVNTSFWADGNYQISFTNLKGGYLCGRFNVNTNKVNIF